MKSDEETLEVEAGKKAGTFNTKDGRVLTPPSGWALLPPGDAALTRRVKAAGPHWAVKQRRGRKLFTKGVYAPAEIISRLKVERDAEKQDPAYLRRLEQSRARRAREQVNYVETFRRAVLTYLDFHPRHEVVARELSEVVTEHATPVGSGTVARTQRISVDRRVEAAVIAWMRHETTAYDNMRIPRVKGRRREVRRKLAERSRRLLNAYRVDQPVDGEACLLQQALREEY